MTAVASSSSSAAATNQWADLSFVEVLEDLSSRFIVNLPNEELQRIERICFQVEQAHWFYEDFLRPLNASLPSLNLRKFSIYILQTASLSIPLIRQYVSSDADTDGTGTVRDWQTLGGATYGLEAAFDEFMKYKTRVPVCGAVLLSDDWKSCLLVKGWKSSAAWGFPKGKINQSETHRDCAVRETYEETGFDCSHLLKPDSPDWMELNVREQKMRLYIVPGVKKDTPFETQTRKEISKIAWFKLSDLPTWKQSQANGGGGLASANARAKFYLVTPFIGKLKQWIRDNKKRHLHLQGQSAAKDPHVFNALHAPVPPPAAADAPLGGGVTSPSGSAAMGSAGSDAAPVTATQPAGQPGQPLFVDSTSAWPLSGYGAEARPTQPPSGHGEGAANGDSLALLSMLQGSLRIDDRLPGHADEASQSYTQPAPAALDQHSRAQAQLQQLRMLSSESPLPAPRAQKASNQTLKLLEMLSPNSPKTDRAEPNQRVQTAPSAEEDRARKREALLTQLLKGNTAPDSGDGAPQAPPLPSAQPSSGGSTDRSSKEAALLSLLQGQTASNATPTTAPMPSSLPGPPAPTMPAMHSAAAHPGYKSPAMPHLTGASGGTSSPDAGRASLLAMLNAGPISVPHHGAPDAHERRQEFATTQAAATFPPPVPGQHMPQHLSPHPQYAGHHASPDALLTQFRRSDNHSLGGFAPAMHTTTAPLHQQAAVGAPFSNGDPATHSLGPNHAGLHQAHSLPTQSHQLNVNGSHWSFRDVQGQALSPGQFKLYPGHSPTGVNHADASPMYSHASPVAFPNMPHTQAHAHHGYQPPPMNFRPPPPPYLHAPPGPRTHYQGDAGHVPHVHSALPSPSTPNSFPATGPAVSGTNDLSQSNGNQSLLALLNGRAGPQ